MAKSLIANIIQLKFIFPFLMGTSNEKVSFSHSTRSDVEDKEKECKTFKWDMEIQRNRDNITLNGNGKSSFTSASNERVTALKVSSGGKQVSIRTPIKHKRLREGR